jgi:hypothetical protein
MIYSDIIKYFEKGEQGITELLIKCQPEFESINDIQGRLKANLITDDESLSEALSQLTGIYMYFEPIFEVSQAYKEIEEDRIYSAIRVAGEKGLEIYKDDVLNFEIPIKKITDNILKSEAHRGVRTYIRVRNAFEGYVKACDKGIASIQSLLKREQKDKYKPVE